VEYALDWKKFDKTEISPTLFYEYYETSGQLPEQAHRVGAALGIRRYLTNSITLGLDYRFIYKDSNFDGFDYYQNLGFVSLYYKF
jgi:hemolysin activation/secretion protein